MSWRVDQKWWGLQAELAAGVAVAEGGGEAASALALLLAAWELLRRPPASDSSALSKVVKRRSFGGASQAADAGMLLCLGGWVGGGTGVGEGQAMADFYSVCFQRPATMQVVGNAEGKPSRCPHAPLPRWPEFEAS